MTQDPAAYTPDPTPAGYQRHDFRDGYLLLPAGWAVAYYDENQIPRTAMAADGQALFAVTHIWAHEVPNFTAGPTAALFVRRLGADLGPRDRVVALGAMLELASAVPGVGVVLADAMVDLADIPDGARIAARIREQFGAFDEPASGLAAPVEPRRWCPGCEPDVDETLEFVMPLRCGEHSVIEPTPEDEAINRKAGMMGVGGGIFDAAVNRRMNALVAGREDPDDPSGS